MEDPQKDPDRPEAAGRRRFLSSAAMTAGLAGGYGAFGLIAGRYLYPARPADRQWQFVAEADGLEVGESLLYRGPAGETIHVTRKAGSGDVSDFIALSSTCPHLGCQVHWEAQNERYFCPCHNGTFDPEGRGTGGPPGDAGQSLPRYPLKVEKGLLFIEVPVSRLASRTEGGLSRPGLSRPGHDLCLTPDPDRGGGRRT